MPVPTVSESLPGLFREACSSAQAIRSIGDQLTAAGLDDISAEGALALTAMIVPHTSVDEVMRVLGVSAEAASEMTEALVLRGYLERRAGPDQGQVRVSTTGRGQVAVSAVKEGVQAARWVDLSFRPDDIVISTGPKSGTTWMQMICALLIFQAPELPAALSDLSPWLDELVFTRDELYAQLNAQQHRRFIKTHLPLNVIPVRPGVTYIVVVRDPLDAAISFLNAQRNVAHPTQPGDRPGSGPPPEPQLPPQREWLLGWLDGPGLPHLLAHVSAAWTLRAEPNVVLVRYEDLRADLDGQMRRLAARLGTDVPEATWPSLVAAAGFTQMRAAADKLVPTNFHFKSNADFFLNGTSGTGRELLSAAELARYHQRAAKLAPPDMLAWLLPQDGAG